MYFACSFQTISAANINLYLARTALKFITCLQVLHSWKGNTSAVASVSTQNLHVQRCKQRRSEELNISILKTRYRFESLRAAKKKQDLKETKACIAEYSTKLANRCFFFT